MIDFVTRVLFESLPWLLVFCALAFTIALVVHRRRQSRASRRSFWIVLALCAGLIVLQHVVVTDREAIEADVRAMADAVDDGDYLDASFRWDDENREQFLASATRTLQAVQIDSAHVIGFKAEVHGDSARVTVTAVCDVRRGSDSVPNFISQWDLRFVRRGDRWLLERVEDGSWKFPIGGAGGSLRKEVR
jgi:hypothetical protein